MMWLKRIIIGAAAVSVASTSQIDFGKHDSKRDNVCDNPVQGLLREDCEYMFSIGVGQMGMNDFSNNNRIWIGNNGSNELTFTNRADSSVVVLIWYSARSDDYQCSFVNVRQPYVTYSLPNTGDSVIISVADNVSGGFAALYDRTTTLSQYGQVYNTWGEFTSGNYATIDVSREPNMRGNRMEIRTGGGCVSNMDICVFKCYSGDHCWQDNEYYLQNCEVGSQRGNPHSGFVNGQPQGGCGGWENGGAVQIDFFN